jgi:hypothetical protein
VGGLATRSADDEITERAEVLGPADDDEAVAARMISDGSGAVIA